MDMTDSSSSVKENSVPRVLRTVGCSHPLLADVPLVSGDDEFVLVESGPEAYNTQPVPPVSLITAATDSELRAVGLAVSVTLAALARISYTVYWCS